MSSLAFLPVFPSPPLPPVVKPPVGPPQVEVLLVILWLLDLLRQNDEVEEDQGFVDWLFQSKGEFARRRAGKACAECCSIVAREAVKAERDLVKRLDEKATATNDNVTRRSVWKTTRNPP